MQSIGKFLKKFVVGREYRVLFMGLDASGKTTALYYLKLGETVTTIPTIGFNVETIECGRTKFVAWDVGGADKIRPLMRHYFAGTDAIIFCVDSRDSDRLLHRIGDKEFNSVQGYIRYMFRDAALNGLPVAVACTKQDSESALSVAEISVRLNLGAELRRRKWAAFSCSIDGRTATGWPELVHWLCAAMADPRVEDGASAAVVPSEVGESGEEKSEDSDERQCDSSSELLERFLQRRDIAIEEMLYRMEDCSLCSEGSAEGCFDHYVLLRVAFAYLVRFGRRKGLARLFSDLQRFSRESSAAKHTFSVTVTYFWAHMVWFTLHSTQALGSTLWAEAQRSDDKQLSHLFKRLLFLNPTLCESALFKEYYSESLFLESEQSRAEFAAADIKPLPTAVGDDIDALKRELKDFDSTEALAALRKADLSDAEFIEAFEAQALEQWSHECRLRVIWCYLSKLGKGTRKLAVDTIMEQMQAHCGAHFHLTETYFWLQLVDFYRMLHSADCFSDWLSHLKELAFSVESLSGAESKSWLKKLVSKQSPAYDLCDSQLWRAFYSPPALFPKVEAADSGPSKVFLLPDIQPLPSIKPTAASG